MPIDLATFRRVADSALFTSRDIKLQGQGADATARLGNYLFSAGKKANDAVMTAFRSALEREYGALGIHAFDTIVGSRNQLHKSLRACDVKSTLSNLATIRRNRYIGEVNRQLDTHPKMLELSDEMQLEVRRRLHADPLAGKDLLACKSPGEVAQAAEDRILAAIRDAQDFARNNLEDAKLDGTTKELGPGKSDAPKAKGSDPVGLKNLKTLFTKGFTSIEDRIKSGRLGTGMRVNRSHTNPVLLQKLKTNGVEPGFIYTNDWSADDTRGFLADIDSPESLAALEKLKEQDADFRDSCLGLGTREQIMLAGRAHPAGMAAVGEYMLEKGMRDPNSAIYRAFCERFPLVNPEDWETQYLATVKKELFAEIRDAVMSVKAKLENGSANPEYFKSPIFRHFNERHIMKLDYNENDRVVNKSVAHAGSFQRPERILTTRKPILAQYYRFDTAQSADDISAGAVTEALANDLTRLAGVPSQELEIVRGQYSDGHPKLMLQAKFAEGYQDMEAGFIKDGRIVPPKRKNGKPVELESLGKYKAFFLLTADRDAVGKRGQNKGFAQGKFFAIDPGHSLEGNGKYLEISDDFSFKDTYGASTKPRFKNFSVFDDDTRFAKFQGLVQLRELQRSGAFKELFDSYRKAFDPNAEGLSDAERTMRQKVIDEIGKKETEFNAQMKKLLKVGAMQLELYDRLAGTGLQETAIENLANFEKLCSPTTWVSKHGEVPLKHLEVKPETRIPWRAGVVGDNLVYHCDKSIPPQALEHIRTFGADWGVKVETDGFGATRVTIPKDRAAGFFAYFNEDKVAQLTHPAEHAARRGNGSGLAEAAQYKPFALPKFNDPRPSLSAAQLPPYVEFTDNTGKLVRMPKLHYETMVTTMRSGFHRPRTVEQLVAHLKARVDRGNEIVQSLLRGDVARFEANEQNVAALSIAIHAAALKKGEMMYRGSFSVADPQGNIARWLDTNPNLYQRTSTHAKPYQGYTVDGHLNMPRGFDVREGMGGLLNGMRTFHYFSLPDMKHLNDVDRGSGPDRRLFFKCETYGIYFSTIHAKRTAKADSRTEDMRTRWYEFGDVCESIAHCASLLVSKITSKTKEGIRKENLPTAVGAAMMEAQAALLARGLTDASHTLMAGEVLDGGGIRQFLANVETAIMNSPEDQRETVRETLTPFLRRIDDAVKHIAGDINLRMGNEIMLETQDFSA
jgi:hypothetical protein